MYLRQFFIIGLFLADILVVVISEKAKRNEAYRLVVDRFDKITNDNINFVLG